MTDFVTSADGTRIAYDRVGSGPAVILVAAAMQFRAFDPGTAEMAHLLAEHGYTVINYDRRGRGESTDTHPFEVDREVEDIAALIDEVGGEAALFGSSSGGALALWAAAAGIGVTKLALWEVPLDLDDDGSENLRGLQQRVEADDRDGTVAFFMRNMPPEWLAGARTSPAWPTLLEISPTLVYDAAVLERAQSGTPFAMQWETVTMPTLVMYGQQTLPLFPTASRAIVDALPDARVLQIEAANHGWAPEVMAAVLAEFLSGS